SKSGSTSTTWRPTRPSASGATCCSAAGDYSDGEQTGSVVFFGKQHSPMEKHPPKKTPDLFRYRNPGHGATPLRCSSSGCLSAACYCSTWTSAWEHLPPPWY